MTTKEQILLTAFHLFLDKGYKNTSMTDLMKATKLSKGAFYHHFASKETLYHEVIDQYFLAFYESAGLDDVEVTSIDEVEAMIKGFYLTVVPEILQLSPKGMSRYFILFFEAYDSYPRFKDGVQRFYEELKVLIRRIYRKKKVKDADKEAIRLIAKYEGLMFWLAIYPEGDMERMIKEF